LKTLVIFLSLTYSHSKIDYFEFFTLLRITIQLDVYFGLGIRISSDTDGQAG